eukprot:m.145248 g.145248  ORF g.145248 m.145248 type:complete len:307 (+) comp14138_c1_seq7:608-1528(+)
MHPKGNGKGVGVLIRNYNAPPASKKPPDGEDKFPLGSPSSWSFFKQELSSFWRLALPISVSTLFQFAVSFISFAYIGHLGATELAGASLASTIYSIATMAIYGGATAMNTLVSQALGADNKQLVGAWLQSGLLGLAIIAVVAIALTLLTGQIVGLIEKDEDVVEKATLYGQWCAPSLLPIALFAVLRQYFQSQDIVLPGTIVSGISVGVHAGFCQLFVTGVGSWNGLGLRGAALALLVTTSFQLISFYLYTVAWRKLHAPTWFGWCASSFSWTSMKTFLGVWFAFSSLNFSLVVMLDSATSWNHIE